MVSIPAGDFIMGSPKGDLRGSPDERPQHRVHIGAFSVSSAPITRGEWNRFVRDTGRKDHSKCLEGQQDNHPAVCIYWQDAQDYVSWLTRKSGQPYRLLTEAEFEYVLRAGTQTSYFWGDAAEKMSDYMEHRQYQEPGGTAPVRRFKPNAFGLYDITGSVWSWTQDCWHPSYEGAPADGSAWLSGADCTVRVLRGASWYAVNPPRVLRSAYRFRPGVAGFRPNTVGLRVAMTGSATAASTGGGDAAHPDPK